MTLFAIRHRLATRLKENDNSNFAPGDTALHVRRMDADLLPGLRNRVGCCVGSAVGVGAIPASLVAKLEDSPKGQFIPQLAERLHDAYVARAGS